MSRKNLPDSLELLLDTMCNTFGGIMFIAISLVVMSQIISQQQKNMTQEEISKNIIEKMKQNIEALRQENVRLSQQALSASMNTGNVTPEKKAVLQRLKEEREKNLKLEHDIERLESKIRLAEQKQKELDESAKKLVEELELQKSKLRLEKAKLQQRRRDLNAEISKLEETLKNIQPRTLRFAKLKETEKSPYWVLIQRNKIYRLGDSGSPVNGEVELEYFNSGRRVRMKPLNGAAVDDDPETVFNFLFKDVDKERYFVNLVSDNDSFSTLMVARQYLRNKQIHSNWSINPDFEFGVYSNVSYSASE
ncbi:MAG: hypothetical protein IKD44_05990 [Lentisphaeria bacterium]|nr:hypothetical protein [Lentisphaeria bacterium]